MNARSRRLRAGLFAALGFVALSLVTLTGAGCSRRPDLTPREGFVPVTGGRVWYRIVGTGHGTPLLVLHGGPGAPSYYLKPLGALGDDRPVIFYDQLGCGHSGKSDDSTLWTLDHYVNEIDEVRHGLGLKDIDLYGHSWGTMLAAEYLFRQPRGVHSVIFSSAALSVPLWIHDADSLRALLPDSLQRAITLHEKDGNTASPDYQNAMSVYYSQHMFRKLPPSADIDSSFSMLNRAIYDFMQGPSEFTITGTLKTYDCTQRLHEITVPTLFLAGEHDEATPDATIFYKDHIKGATCVLIPESGHLSMQDNPDRHNQAVRDFLRKVDAAK